MELTLEEKALIKALREHDLKPVTVLMDGEMLCNARKIDNQYNQAFFEDRGASYKGALSDFRRECYGKMSGSTT